MWSKMLFFSFVFHIPNLMQKLHKFTIFKKIGCLYPKTDIKSREYFINVNFETKYQKNLFVVVFFRLQNFGVKKIRFGVRLILFGVPKNSYPILNVDLKSL